MLLSSFMPSRFIPFVFAFACVGVSPSWGAGVGINATRVIVNQGSQVPPVTLRNSTDKITYLVQSYLSTDNPQSTASVPFDVLPPMIKMGPNSQQDVRLVEKEGLTSRLPTDRESVFYFHARAIPNNDLQPIKNPNDNHGMVKIALENVIKVFYRPTGLTSSATQAQASLVFQWVPSGLKVTNSSPYHVTLAGLTVSNRAIPVSQQEAMIAPFSERTYPTTDKNGAITWTTINDLGGYDVHHASR